MREQLENPKLASAEKHEYDTSKFSMKPPARRGPPFRHSPWPGRESKPTPLGPRQKGPPRKRPAFRAPAITSIKPGTKRPDRVDASGPHGLAQQIVAFFLDRTQEERHVGRVKNSVFSVHPKPEEPDAPVLVGTFKSGVQTTARRSRAKAGVFPRHKLYPSFVTTPAHSPPTKRGQDIVRMTFQRCRHLNQRRE
jgi:hypothetical protein